MSPPSSFRTADVKSHVRPFGFQLTIDSLQRQGHVIEQLKPSHRDGTILMSLYWMEDLYELIRWRKRNGIDGKFQFVVGGNHATGYPNSLVSFSDGVYCGDGEMWDGSLDALVTSDRRLPIVANTSIPKAIIELENKSTTTGKRVNIVELTRGCKNMCHFCQYAWAKPFRAGDMEFILSSISTIDARTIRLVSADCQQHPQHDAIMTACDRAGIRNVSQDNSLLELRKTLPRVDKVNGTQRFGIDGMSERLRRKMHKRIGTDELIDLVHELYKRGARRFLAYNLFGVPGETRDDFLEYDDTLRRIADRIASPCAFVTCWNAFMPVSLTPLQWEASSWDNDTRDRKRLLQTVDYGERRGVKLYHMPLATGNARITLRVLAMRSSQATRDLVYTVATNNKITEAQILREFERAEGYHLHSQRPLDEQLPWDKYLVYDNALLRRLATTHRKLQDQAHVTNELQVPILANGA
jgi:radical SAM superfamily enzyme YgiQ (UPF0313 family)